MNLRLTGISEDVDFDEGAQTSSCFFKFEREDGTKFKVEVPPESVHDLIAKAYNEESAPTSAPAEAPVKKAAAIPPDPEQNEEPYIPGPGEEDVTFIDPNFSNGKAPKEATEFGADPPPRRIIVAQRPDLDDDGVPSI